MMITTLIKKVFMEYFRDTSLTFQEKYYPVFWGVALPVLIYVLLLIIKPQSFTPFRAILFFLLMSAIVLGSLFRIFWGYFPRYLIKNFENQQQTFTSPSNQTENTVEVEYEVVHSEETEQQQPDDDEKSAE